MKSMTLVIIAALLLLTGGFAQAQGFRGGFGGGPRGGFTAPAPARNFSGQASRAPQRSASPQPQLRSDRPPAHTRFHGPGRISPHRHSPVFAPFGFGKPFHRHSFPSHVGWDHFIPHRHWWGVVDVPVFWGSTIITEVGPAIVQSERRYLPDTSSGARVRDGGQLAPFDPTPAEVVDRMLVLAGVRKDDVVYDLGSGDGRVLIAAANKYGARGVGFETDAGLVKLARENARREGVEKLVEIRHQDFRSADLSPASVVTLYLSYDGNLTVREQLMRQLKPGTRVVSYTFDMGDWPPKIAESYRDAAGAAHAIYLWEIGGPAMATRSSENLLQPHPVRNGPLIIEVR